jgi:hypothetical protein
MADTTAMLAEFAMNCCRLRHRHVLLEEGIAVTVVVAAMFPVSKPRKTSARLAERSNGKY